MRIAALVHFYPPHYMAGSETMLHAMLGALAAAGHDVQVIATSHERGPAAYIHQGIGVRCANRGQAPAALDEFGPQVVVSHHQEVPHACSYARSRKAKAAVIFHNTFPPTLAQARRWRPDLCVFNTDWVAEHFRRRSVPSSRALVVHPPIDADRHRTRPGRHVTLVNLNRDKGGELFYQIAGRMSEVAFLGVVGGHGHQIIRTGVPNVAIQEHTPDPRRDIWARTRILLAPSVYESYGMVGIEAAASGIPTIAAPTPGLRESLGEAGVFVRRGDVEGWVREIRRLLVPGEWRLASKRARERSAELDPREELAAWVEEVECL